jgi:hypothetical protein
MFRDKPSLAAELLRGPLCVPVPIFNEARLSSGDLNDVKPTEYRADAVVTLSDAGTVVLAVVVEVQLHTNKDKRRSWPAYVATLHARLKCPVALLVVCPKQTVANWCAQPIAFGPPASVLTPVALGPKQVPVLTDLDTARRVPELAVLSVLAHGDLPDPEPMFEALLTALDAIDQDRAKLYTDFILSVLPAAARAWLEEHMTIITGYQYQSDFARRYFSEGKAEGEADAVLLILAERDIDVPDHIRAEIVACTDLDRLGVWIRQAATAHSIEDLDL